jgi:tetratricopeptide (TPR) repeat protein
VAARQLEESGAFEQARAELSPFWQGVGSRPDVESLSPGVREEMLLRIGTLAGWICYLSKVADGQEEAKNLISRSLRGFESLGDSEGAGEAQTELAYCYWRTGEYGEARALLQEALEKLKGSDRRSIAVLRMAIVESSEGQNREAIERLTQARDLFMSSSNKAVLARYIYNLAIFYFLVGEAEHDAAAVEMALSEFPKARALFVEIGNVMYVAGVDNVVGRLYMNRRDFNRAHESLIRAGNIFAESNDVVNTAQVDETRARAYLMEGKNTDAEMYALASVERLRGGDASSVLAESLITLGMAQARTGKGEDARLSFVEAIALAELVGALSVAGMACVVALEELCGRVAARVLTEFYERGTEIIQLRADRELECRLHQATCNLLRNGVEATGARGIDFENVYRLGIKLPGSVVNWENFSLREQLRIFEREWIRRALKEAGGSPCKAAGLLGFNHHESLIGRIRDKYKDLQVERTPRLSRKKSYKGRRSAGRLSGAGLNGKRSLASN